MFVLKKLGCRAIQLGFRCVTPLMPYREPKIIPSTAQVGDVLKAEKRESVLILTSKSVLKNGLTDALLESLTRNEIKYTVYGNVRPDPTVDTVEEILSVYLENGCDSLIAIGGGSAMDAAKAVGARVAYSHNTVGQLRGLLRITRKIPTLVAIPTTAGTGSEVTPAAVIIDSAKQSKYALMSFPLIPRYAVLDAKMTYTLPPSMTATTGMDTLTHALEAYIGGCTTKETRELAIEAIRLVFENIEVAYNDGYNETARDNMLRASYKAGLAFSRSFVGYVHAISHSLGGKYGVAHGWTNAIVMPYVLEAYGESAYKKLHCLEVAAGVASENDTDELGAKKLISAIREMNRRMDIPDRITQIRREDIPELARHAYKEATPLYPVPRLMDREELEAIYRKLSDGSYAS